MNNYNLHKDVFRLKESKKYILSPNTTTHQIKE